MHARRRRAEAQGKTDEERARSRVTCLCGRRKTRGTSACEACRSDSALTWQEVLDAYNARNPGDRITMRELRIAATSAMQKLRALMYRDIEAGDWIVDAVDCLDERRGEQLMAERRAHLGGEILVEGIDP